MPSIEDATKYEDKDERVELGGKSDAQSVTPTPSDVDAKDQGKSADDR